MANYKIAIIVGSLRKDSINRKIARSMCGPHARARGPNTPPSTTRSKRSYTSSRIS